MRSLILPVLSVACMFGCTSPQQQAQMQQAEMARMIAEFGPACSQLGYAVQSDAWRNCVVQLAAKNDVKQGGVSTSIYGSWGGSGGWGRGSGVGIGIGLGR